MFQESLQTLKMARSKFAGSKEALEQINPSWKDKEILVPLTGSMYVPGIVKQVDSFIIDVGTGYYAEKVCQFFFKIFCFDECGITFYENMRSH